MIRLTDAEAIGLGAGGLVWRDAFVDPALGNAARELLGLWHAQGRMTAAGTGRAAQRLGIRDDQTVWLEPSDPEPLASLFVHFERLRIELSTELRLGLQRFSVQAARYDVGAGYQRHRDAFRGDATRVVTAILYLNAGWLPEHGGLLRAWTPEGVLEVEPLLGRLVLFRSDTVPHEVLPARALRWAVTAWYRGAEAIPLLPDPPASAGDVAGVVEDD